MKVTTNYLVVPGIAALCYVMIPVKHTHPWDGATVIYMSPEKPLTISGSFDPPPEVQKSIHDHFVKVFAMDVGARNEYLRGITPWQVDVTVGEDDPG